jgi:hypothetical protein
MLLFIDHKTFQGAGELVAVIGEDEWTGEEASINKHKA